MNQPAVTHMPKLSIAEFRKFQKLIFEIAGISMPEAKQTLVESRLSKRLRQLEMNKFGDYHTFITHPANSAELQTAVDLLTTNETFFFREPEHFEFLRKKALQHTGGVFRVWSAASSSGEEAYSIAMILDDVLGGGRWEVVGTDISTRVLERARIAHYPTERIDSIPKPLLKRYCLKGMGEEEGTLLITRELRDRVRFLHNNLLSPRKDLGQFDVIFLRNVMIYFDVPTKQKVVSGLLPYLKKGGHFLVGHSESLNGVSADLIAVRPTIYARRRST